MKVRDLIDKLEKIRNKDMEVYLEGCHCNTEWNGEFDESFKYFSDNKDVNALLLKSSYE